MSDEKKEPWLGYLALITVVLAVCATLSTFKGGGYSTRSVISQAQASDQWAFFQAKSIRENMYRLQKENLTLTEGVLPANATPEVRGRYEAAIALAEKNVQKYEQEKNTIKAEAQRLEKQRDDAQRHGQPFGMAVIFLQVAILISSIAGLLKRRPIWYAALPFGAVGLLYFADGFLLFL
ncbi:MAG: DUF4337 domain-containing protein [bacterium]|nr:DUF4337 domain-containing protein [bacterium]